MQLKNPLGRLNLVFWQPLLAYGASIVLCLALLVYRLGTLVPGFSVTENATISAVTSLKQIFHQPLFAPHSVLQYIAIKIGHHGFIAMRLPSVLLGLASVILFYYIVERWFSFQVAIVTTILFATSSWFLQLSRAATPDVTFLGLLAPLAFAIWLPNYKKPLVALVVGAVVLTSSLYIPGFIWFIALGIVWQRRNLVAVFKDAKIPTIFILCACIMLLSPLVISLADSPLLVKEYFGLPASLTDTIVHLPKNLLLIPYHLALVGPINAETNLGRLPLLDFFATVMATLGAYSYAIHRRLRRSQLLLASLILCSLLVAVGGLVSIAILLPFVYLLVASGLNFMIEQWSMVFPANPFARSLATVLIAAAVTVVVLFHIDRFYVAWPQTPATKAAYNHQPLNLN